MPGRYNWRLPEVVAFAAATLLCLGSARGENERAASCPAHIVEWVARAAREIDVAVEPVSCPEDVTVLRLRPEGTAPLLVEVAETPGRGFRQIGPFRVSPIVEVDDYRSLPSGQRRAFEAFLQWLEANVDGIVTARGPPRLPHGFLRWLCWGLLLLGAVLLVVMARRRSSPAESAEEEKRELSSPLRRAVAAVAVLLAVIAIGAPLVPPDVSFHSDTVRDLLIAGELLGPEARPAMGPRSSAGFYQGALFHWLLSPFVAFDIPPRAILPLLLLLYAGGALLLFLTLRRLTDTGMAALGVAVYALYTFDKTLFDPLWNPTLLPAVMAAYVFFGHMATRPGRFHLVGLIAATLCLSLGSQLHLQVLFLVPSHLALTLSGPRGRLPRLLIVLGLLAISWDLISPDALRANLDMAAAHLSGMGGELASHRATSNFGSGLCLALALGAAIATALLLRTRSSRQPRHIRAFTIFLGAGAVSYSLACALVFQLIPFLKRYLDPLWPFLVLIAMLAISHGLGRASGSIRRTVAIAACIVIALVTFRGNLAKRWIADRPTLSLGEMASLHQAISGRGYDLDQTWRSLSSGQGMYQDYLAGMWLWSSCPAPPLPSTGSSRQMPRLLLTVLPKGVAAGLELTDPDAEVVAGRWRDFLLMEYEPFVRPDRVQVCRQSRSGQQCERLDFSLPGPGRNSGPRCRGLPDATRGLLRGRSTVVTLRFDVEVPAEALPRVVFFGAPQNMGGARRECTGQVLEVNGLESSEQRDDATVEIRSTDHRQRGTLRVSWPWTDSRCFYGRPEYPLPIFEAEPQTYQALAPYLIP